MTRLIVLGMLSATLSGCITAEDRYVFNDYYTRSEVDHINASQQCKLLARSLVQIARCDVRR